MVTPRAPDWLMKLEGPGGGMVGAKVAFSETPSSVLRRPMQLGPTSRIPKSRQTPASRRSRSAPSGPTSLKPAEMTTTPFTPFSPHSRTTSRTCSLGTTTTARSTGPGMCPTDG